DQPSTPLLSVLGPHALLTRHALLGERPFLLAIELSCFDRQPTPPVPVELFPHRLLDGATAISVQPGFHPPIDLLDKLSLERDGDLLNRHHSSAHWYDATSYRMSSPGTWVETRSSSRVSVPAAPARCGARSDRGPTTYNRAMPDDGVTPCP